MERPHRRYGPLSQAMVLAGLGLLDGYEVAHLRRLAEHGLTAADARRVLAVVDGLADAELIDRGLR